jgi:hypothetical protein
MEREFLLGDGGDPTSVKDTDRVEMGPKSITGGVIPAGPDRIQFDFRIGGPPLPAHAPLGPAREQPPTGPRVRGAHQGADRGRYVLLR